MNFQVKMDPGFKDATRRQASFLIREFIIDLKSKFYELFGGIKTGRFYYRPKPKGGRYQASAPGEPPAIRSGNLLRSIKESFPSQLKGEITIRAPYAIYLEEGTPKMATRPFVRPAINSVTDRYNTGARSKFI